MQDAYEALYSHMAPLLAVTAWQQIDLQRAVAASWGQLVSRFSVSLPAAVESEGEVSAQYNNAAAGGAAAATAAAVRSPGLGQALNMYPCPLLIRLRAKLRSCMEKQHIRF